MKAKAHPNRVHKYKRVPVKGKDSTSESLYRCVLPGCMHYLRSVFIIGAISECWRCGKDFVIEKEHLKPHCQDCTKRKNVVDEDQPEPIPESPI